MRRILGLGILVCLVAALAFISTAKQQDKKGAKPDFDMTASYIEACSCDMFCPCYFNTHSTAHHSEHAAEHYCRANLVLKVDKGYYKTTKLDGAKVWIATDLGSDWSTGKDSWAVVNFDPSVTGDQKAALTAVNRQRNPFKWQNLDADTQRFTGDMAERSGMERAKTDQ